MRVFGALSKDSRFSIYLALAISNKSDANSSNLKHNNCSYFGRIAADKVARRQWPDADTYILLGPKNDKSRGNFYGIANGGWNYGHGVCSSNIARRVSINWFETDTNYNDGIQEDDLLTALVRDCLQVHKDNQQ